MKKIFSVLMVMFLMLFSSCIVSAEPNGPTTGNWVSNWGNDVNGFNSIYTTNTEGSTQTFTATTVDENYQQLDSVTYTLTHGQYRQDDWNSLIGTKRGEFYTGDSVNHTPGFNY